MSRAPQAPPTTLPRREARWTRRLPARPADHGSVPPTAPSIRRCPPRTGPPKTSPAAMSDPDAHILKATVVSAARRQSDLTSTLMTASRPVLGRLGRLERAGVQTSLCRTNTEGIGSEGQHGRHRDHRKEHRQRSSPEASIDSARHIVSKLASEQRIDGTADRGQQQSHDRERRSDRQQRQPARPQLEPHLRARRRRGGTRELEQAGEPVQESGAGSPGPLTPARRRGAGAPRRRPSDQTMPGQSRRSTRSR